jgi:restriction system protein
MAIPTFDEMLRPILHLAASQQITRREATEAMAGHFGLSDQERTAILPSGSSTYVANRTGWAMTFLTKGGLIERVAPRTYRATERGRMFLTQYPDRISQKDLATIEGWEEAWSSRASRRRRVDPLPGSDGVTPVEILDNAVSAIHAEVRSRLMDAILRQSPAFFEQLVLDVLIAMGYGGSRAEAAHHLGRSGDEGIDGRINQDPLGLDQIMVQAKRNAPENVIDRKTIQAFIGSLAGQGVTKGVFITTSSFADSAQEFVLRGSNTKVVLIDGEALLDLMLRHHIGVRAERRIEILDLDQNYFEEAE